VYKAKGDYENALGECRKALEIELKVLGPNHPDTASSYNNIGAMYDEKGDCKNALVEYRKALEIELKVFGPNHSHTMKTQTDIKRVLSMI
jgi:tetratricopeptide (TPR) repeat protein